MFYLQFCNFELTSVLFIFEGMLNWSLTNKNIKYTHYVQEASIVFKD